MSLQLGVTAEIRKVNRAIVELGRQRNNKEMEYHSTSDMMGKWEKETNEKEGDRRVK